MQTDHWEEKVKLKDRYDDIGRVNSGYYSIELYRADGSHKVLGTVPNYDSLEKWFDGAYRIGVLPNPPLYTDEIRVYSVGMEEVPTPTNTLKWVWRLTWMQFEAKPLKRGPELIV